VGCRSSRARAGATQGSALRGHKDERRQSAQANLPELITCASCGLALPEFARFCAHCGKRLPATRRRASPVWVLILFWLGTVAALAVSLAYTLAVVIPDLPARGVDPRQLRAVAGAVAVVAGCMFIAQLITSVGLTLGRSWAKGWATLVCVAWALTCIGLPLAVLALNAIWRPLKPARPAVP
jgi:predicted nucleic acid-binding Zn ribbon protein